MAVNSFSQSASSWMFEGALNMPRVRNINNARVLHMSGYQDSEYTSRPEYTRALIMPLVPNMPGF